MRERAALVERLDPSFGTALYAAFPEGISPRSSIRVLHPGGVGADDCPFVSALYENIHPAPVAARVLSSVGSLFGDSGLDHGDIVQHLHVHRSNLKGLESMIAGFQIA